MVIQESFLPHAAGEKGFGILYRSFCWSTKGINAILKSSYLTKVMGNDLSRGLFPAKEVKLLVVDEAHKAQGDYAYCLVARLLSCFLDNIDLIPS